NSEIICGATSRDKEADYSKGIAIASSFQPDPDTTIEVVRYPEKSDVMSFLGTLLVDDGTRLTRPLKWLGTCLRHPVDFLRTFNPVGWAKRSTIVLVMQNVDSAFRLVRERRWLWPFRKTLTSRRDPGQPPIPAYLPVANQAARHIAETTNAFPSSSINEVVLNVPTTAHILGGASMGTSPADGVIDARNRVFGYENLYVVDGSMIPSNLGVNPSLTITAMAEHALSHIPPKDATQELRHLPEQARAAATGDVLAPVLAGAAEI
ncbi:MAG TPA: GMC family oxidoreductase, partial [Thermoanaerobaculia bacterium]